MPLSPERLQKLYDAAHKKHQSYVRKRHIEKTKVSSEAEFVTQFNLMLDTFAGGTGGFIDSFSEDNKVTLTCTGFDKEKRITAIIEEGNAQESAQEGVVDVVNGAAAEEKTIEEVPLLDGEIEDVVIVVAGPLPQEHSGGYKHQLEKFVTDFIEKYNKKNSFPTEGDKLATFVLDRIVAWNEEHEDDQHSVVNFIVEFNYQRKCRQKETISLNRLVEAYNKKYDNSISPLQLGLFFHEEVGRWNILGEEIERRASDERKLPSERRTNIGRIAVVEDNKLKIEEKNQIKGVLKSRRKRTKSRVFTRRYENHYEEFDHVKGDDGGQSEVVKQTVKTVYGILDDCTQKEL